MSIDKDRLRHNFDRQAGRYDAVALVQQQLARELAGRLRLLQLPVRQLLELGCGTGYYTALLREVFPAARITAVDLAPQALALAQARLGARNHIDWRVGDGETDYWGEFDLITANSVFQWFTRPAAALARLCRQLRSGGWLAFSAFGPATFQELAASLAAAARETGRPPLRLPAQDFLLGGQWREGLAAAGFLLQDYREERWQRSYPDFPTLLRSIQQTGATSTRPTFLPRRLLAAAQTYYSRHYCSQGQLQVTYHTYLILARRP